MIIQTSACGNFVKIANTKLITISRSIWIRVQFFSTISLISRTFFSRGGGSFLGGFFPGGICSWGIFSWGANFRGGFSGGKVSRGDFSRGDFFPGAFFLESLVPSQNNTKNSKSFWNIFTQNACTPLQRVFMLLLCWIVEESISSICLYATAEPSEKTFRNDASNRQRCFQLSKTIISGKRCFQLSNWDSSNHQRYFQWCTGKKIASPLRKISIWLQQHLQCYWMDNFLLCSSYMVERPIRTCLSLNSLSNIKHFRNTTEALKLI